MAQTGSNPGGEPSTDEARRAARGWWDTGAEAYLCDHGSFLGDEAGDGAGEGGGEGAGQLVWGPEGWTETDLDILGDLAGERVLDLGCGAGHGTRWVANRAAAVVGLDLSDAMLAGAQARGSRTLVQADALSLPFAAGTFDVVFSAYGAAQFVADLDGLLREVARVLAPGGRFTFAVTHPVRWAFPDDPGPAGLTATRSYFNRTPYTEHDDDGVLVYAEFHRTLGDYVSALTASGLQVVDLIEPEWPSRNTETWDGWSPLRGRSIPGTAIFVTRR